MSDIDVLLPGDDSAGDSDIESSSYDQLEYNDYSGPVIHSKYGGDYKLIKWRGSPVRIYESGQIRDESGRRVLRMSDDIRVNHTIKTSAEGRALARKRQEKAAESLRAAVVAEWQKSGRFPASSSAEVFGLAGGELFRQVVLDESNYPRDRLQAWEKIGKYAGVLLDLDESGGPGGGDSGDLRGVLADIAAIARASMRSRGDD